MRIAFLGDVAFFGKNAIESNPAVRKNFEHVAKLLSDFDHVVANLETPFVTDQKPFAPKSAHIKSDPANIELLQLLSIDIVNLANNHIYDYGQESLELTKRTLEDAGIRYFGTDQCTIYLEEESKLALSGYCCYSTNPLGMDIAVNVLDIQKVESDMLKNKEKGYLNIVNAHFGQEHVHTPHYDHLTFARQLSDNFDYVLVGHHPHVIQGIERYNKSILAYSLGNFCFDDVYVGNSSTPLVSQTEQNKKSYILVLDIVENEVKDFDVIPVSQKDMQLKIGEEQVLLDIEKYNRLLQDKKEVYLSKRAKALNKYVNSRKEMRNLKWYLKRLRPDSAKRILATRRNKRMYQKCFAEKLY